VKLLLPSLILVSLFVLCAMDAENAEAKTYSNDKYTLEYPNGCKIEKKESRYSSTDANVECKGNGDPALHLESSDTLKQTVEGYSDDEIVTQLEDTFGRLYDNTYVVESGYDKYAINNQTVPYVIGTYDQGFSNAFGFESTKPYVALIAYVRVGEDVMLFQYINTEDDFDKWLPKAEQVLHSIKSTGKTTTMTETETSDDKATNTNTNTSKGTYNSDELPQTSKYCNTVKTQLGKELCDQLLS
jgi:hypothetical protein